MTTNRTISKRTARRDYGLSIWDLYMLEQADKMVKNRYKLEAVEYMAATNQRIRTEGYLYHVTSPEVAAIILRDGFQDHISRVQHGPFGGPPITYPPGVWFADFPHIGAISIDAMKQYRDHADTDEAWIRIKVTPEEFDYWFRTRERYDFTWGARQWLMEAVLVNTFPRSEMALADVLKMRLIPDLDGSGLDPTVEFMRAMIGQELTDPTIKARWNEALSTVEI
jgi:hypothetical protein